MLRTAIFILFISWFSGITAQDYHHYWISWSANGQAYAGVMAVNTRLPTQVLRLSFYDATLGSYRLIEQRYTLSYVNGYYYLRNKELTDRTFCDIRPAFTYSPDQFFFVENDYELAMWCMDAQGVTAAVYSEFIPLKEIDEYKPYFWPEKYGHCNTPYWRGIMYALFE